MSVCYIGLGSNLQNPQQQLNAAKIAIDQIPNSKVMQCSSIYQSEAIALDSITQPDYLNAVIQIETKLMPEVLLDELQTIENQQGRVREKRWGERTIDLDILLFGDQQIKTERLTIPHCEMKNRNFVLYPLSQISPELTFSDNEKLEDLLSAVSDQCLIKLGEFNG
jgi:2-amino-4-hydroxy-6-hydroxymethyldihydropteridine diphosphokinase